jgi:CO dehydrogenase/acetyl-CoA synthase beta subunit
MIVTKTELQKVLEEVNKVFKKLDDRITELEQKQVNLRKTEKST